MGVSVYFTQKNTTSSLCIYISLSLDVFDWVNSSSNSNGGGHGVFVVQVGDDGVLPDGSVLRPRLPGRPTKDCLFADPTRDNATLLKIWNMNKYNGVIGVYNCQGAAWSSKERKNAFHEMKIDAIIGYVRGHDVHLLPEIVAGGEWGGGCAGYGHLSGEIVVLPYNVVMPVTLKVLEHEVFTVPSIRVLGVGVNFAPIGLVDMFNAGGAIEGVVYEEGNVRMEVKGCGRFGGYSSAKPKRCLVGSNMVDFDYDLDSGLLILKIDYMPEEGQKVHIVEV